MTADVLPPSVRATRGHFVLESGHHSDLWLDLEGLCLHPRAVQRDADRLASLLRPCDVDAVCGPLNEGAFVALMVASTLGCAFTYAERFQSPDRGGALFPVDYRLPAALRDAVRGRRVAIVNDVTSAGSAVRGAYADLDAAGARVVAIASLLVLGPAIRRFAEERGAAVVALQEVPHHQWVPAECPLCAAKVALESGGAA